MKTSTYRFITTGQAARFGKSTLLAFTVASALALSSKASAVMLQGNPYKPSGANYTITGAQGVNSANPFGTSGFLPQVNTDFEFTPSIGVSYDTGGGKLKDFGIGLYTPSKGGSPESTGLRITYTSPILASSASAVVEDFDVKTFPIDFKTGKVEPTIVLLNAAGGIYATAKPSQISSALTPHNAKVDDVWDVNFSKLLSNLGKADAPISGFILSADSLGGETPNSDPYLLVSVGNGGVIPVPEVSTILPIVGLLTAVLSTAVLRRRKAAELGMA